VFFASGSLKPLWANTLMPLSWYGLWDAEIITPAAKRPGTRQVRHARRGNHAGITHFRAAACASPAATSRAIQVPDSRVSAPIRISGPGLRCGPASSPSASAESVDRGRVQRVFSRHAANAVRTKKLFSHGNYRSPISF
jgi:hypothetical protein